MSKKKDNKIRIHVTAKDLREGTPSLPDKCPVARTLRRKFPTRKISVGISEFKIGVGRYGMTDAMKEFVSNFDDGPGRFVELKPRSFIVNLSL